MLKMKFKFVPRSGNLNISLCQSFPLFRSDHFPADFTSMSTFDRTNFAKLVLPALLSNEQINQPFQNQEDHANFMHIFERHNSKLDIYPSQFHIWCKFQTESEESNIYLQKYIWNQVKPAKLDFHSRPQMECQQKKPTNQKYKRFFFYILEVIKLQNSDFIQSIRHKLQGIHQTWLDPEFSP